MNEAPHPPLYAVSSERVGGREALRRFHESVQDVFDTAPVERHAVQDFRLDMRASHLGSLVLTEVGSLAQRFERDRRMIATAGIDHFLIQLYTVGGYAGLAGGADIRVRAGDICILDLTPHSRSNSTLQAGVEFPTCEPYADCACGRAPADFLDCQIPHKIAERCDPLRVDECYRICGHQEDLRIHTDDPLWSSLGGGW